MEIEDKRTSIILDRLSVNSIDTASGIFIGVNRASGWSSHSKSNQGFGSAGNSHVSGCVSIVNDPDVIDSPIDDRDVFLIGDNSEEGESCGIAFNSINANALSTNSTITVGNNDQNGWSAHRKNNFGHGRSEGVNMMKDIANIVWDNDVIDSPIHTAPVTQVPGRK